jgi:hypothetical protein
MRRVQLLELHEQPWFPSSIRDEVTDMLQFGLNLSNAYSPTVPLLQQALHSTQSDFVIDLCSGGGGPWLALSRKLQGNGWAVGICLTDKYPNRQAFENVQAISGNITFSPESVDATGVPIGLKGFRTMFTSFHHFPREEARAILQSAVDAGQGIGIFEITRRTPSAVGLMFLWALTPFVLTFFIRPFRWSRLLWTYVIPIIPFVLLFDGVVSCLRTYRPQELQELTEELTGAAYQWETGEHQSAPGTLPVTYLTGCPGDAGRRRSSSAV